VVRYLVRTRYHAAKWAVLAVAFFGFPLLPLLLDVAMFLEPLTLTPSLHHCLPHDMAEELIRFLPRYRRARVLLEVLLEGLPQSTLELFIFLRLHVFSGYGVCADIHRSHFNYDIDRQVLERSLLLSAVALAKVALEFFLADDAEFADGSSSSEAGGGGSGGGGRYAPRGDVFGVLCRGEPSALLTYVRLVLGLGVKARFPPGASPLERVQPLEPSPLEALSRQSSLQQISQREPRRETRLEIGGAGRRALPPHLQRTPSRGAVVDAAVAQLVFVNAVGALA